MRKIKEKLLEEVKQTDRSLVVKVFMASSMILTNRNNNPILEILLHSSKTNTSKLKKCVKDSSPFV